ncbi:uncharacterized protein LOC127757901 [Oryza glaberrima]|uniref:uncharacterized protein LOC127757901 n=1 Tax=Oryza glaberrima TaxID=4538 RepID=UPI00224C2A65|nr:uncharacterized protein LOC127757901 [Oryza glaberrima]
MQTTTETKLLHTAGLNVFLQLLQHSNLNSAPRNVICSAADNLERNKSKLVDRKVAVIYGKLGKKGIILSSILQLHLSRQQHRKNMRASTWGAWKIANQILSTVNIIKADFVRLLCW